MRADDGATILTATGLVPPEQPLLKEVYQALFADIVQVIEYHKDDGIRRAHIEHIGAADGKATMTLKDAPFDQRLLDMGYHRQRQPGLLIDVSALLGAYRQLLTAPPEA